MADQRSPGDGGLITMSWDSVIAIAEVIGVVAIIASLVYVGVQIRQNSAIARATIINATNTQSARMAELIAQDAELAAIYDKGINGKSLAGTDLVRFIALLEIHITWLEDVDAQAELGLFFQDKELADPVEFNRGELAFLFSTPETRQWWNENKQYYRPKFAQKIDRCLDSI